MPREEMLARMTARELMEWQAFFSVRAEEHERQRLVSESGDGQVIITGQDEDADDGDGTTE